MRLPEVSAQMSSDSRMGTPDPISEASVPVIRASDTLWNSGPKIGRLQDELVPLPPAFVGGDPLAEADDGPDDRRR